MKFKEVSELGEMLISKQQMFEIMKSECVVWVECYGESGLYKDRLSYSVEIQEGGESEDLTIYTGL